MLQALCALLAIAALALPVTVSAQAASTPSVPDPLAQQFEVNGDEVYDRKTDRTWQRCNYGQTWDQGNEWCKGVTKHFTIDHAITDVNENAKGWRVPELGELLSIMDLRCASRQQKTGIALVFPEFSREDNYLTVTPHGQPENAMAARCGILKADNFGLSRKYVSIVRLVRTGR